MTNSEQALREFADGIMKSHETWGKPWNAEMREEGIEEIMEITTALISEHYYPKEFVEWTMMQGIMGIYDRKGYLYSSALLNLKGFKGDNTIKNLFNYWKENVR